MLDLSKDMTHADAINHLRATFPLHLTHDVEPSAPFGALRSIFAGIDYVAALYSGWKGGWIVKSANTIGFLKTFFPVATGVDAYSQFADHIYDMFRNGSVHLYLPKNLQNQNPICSTPFLTWCVVTGEHRTGMSEFRGLNFIATHLMPVPIEDTTVLPLSPHALLEDLLKTCDLFAKHLEDEQEKDEHPLLDRLRQTADGITRPAGTGLVW